MKKKIRLFWYLYPSYLFIIFCAVLSISLYLSGFFDNFLFERTRNDLYLRGQLIQNQIVRLIESKEADKIEALCVQSGKAGKTRITIIRPDGVILGDSEKKPSEMNNHKNRPEVLSALEGEIGSHIRSSETLRIRMMYVAAPLRHNGKILAVIRTSIPVTVIDNLLTTVQLRMLLAGLIVALFGSVISFIVSRRISSPIEELKKGAKKFAEGSFDHRLYPPSIRELGSLAEAMNRMAYQLAERILKEEAQKNEYRAVLTSMTEGILGINAEEKVINLNNAARQILGIGSIDLKDKSIQEFVRNSKFIEFVKGAALTEVSLEDDFILDTGEGEIINIRSSVLKNADDFRIGTLIVLNDVTHLRRLENVRKDFVANVSHEIKTPLTAIKGFIETIINLKGEHPENTDRFLKIAMKHVDRLDSILEDLLSLARIEEKQKKPDELYDRINIKDVFETVCQVVQAKADEKNITLKYGVHGELKMLADGRLMEQAILNLVDNAVKYSPEETEVELKAASSEESTLCITISDHGQGIPQKDIPRIFERFYRVDKARSRSMGGTGLGLSIVKHIVQVHGGQIDVESIPGKGTTFIIQFPACE